MRKHPQTFSEEFCLEVIKRSGNRKNLVDLSHQLGVCVEQIQQWRAMIAHQSHVTR